MEWRDIVGYEGLYQISDTGEVKSLERFRYTRYIRNGKQSGYVQKEKIRSQKTCHSTNGLTYKQVALCKDGVLKTLLVHRLVAMAFIPNPDNKPYVNHKDGNTFNNTVQNLGWSTNSENQIHAIKSLGHGQYKQIIAYDKRTRAFVKEFESMTMAANWLRMTGRTKDATCLTGIIKCCKKKIPSYHGFIWRYKEGDE